MSTANLIHIDRAIHEIRCGRPVMIDGKAFIHPEYVDEKKLAELRNKNAFLIITKNRAHSLFKKEFKTCQQISLKDLSIDDVQKLIIDKPTKIFTTEDANIQEGKAALELSRLAQILPCAIIYDAVEADALKTTSKDINEYDVKLTENLEIVSTAPLKLCDAKKAEIKAFRSASGAAEHMAIIIGNIGEEPIIRIHSSCYTGDLIGSLACDCGDQLRGAIKLINDDYVDNNGGGIILYLMQEGRGIGLVNKLHAYELQASAKLDTVEANEFLGFDDEERSFQAAAVMLKKLGVKKVRLITNNPKKIAGLEELGIKVTDRVPMVIRHEHNHAYLEIKSKKSGHIINN